MTITTVEQANRIPKDWPAKNVDIEKAEAQWQTIRPPVNGLEPYEFDMPQLGTWRYERFEGFSVLVEIPVSGMEAAEKEWEFALRYETTQRYIGWQRDGHEPPPPVVITNKHGQLRCMNRRRWLAAREAGVDTLKCWYSPSAGARPKWELK